MCKEKCVICKNETKYDSDLDIEFRDFYIEGVGQLCYNCMNSIQTNELLIIKKQDIINNPNNYELGNYVRNLFNRFKNDSKFRRIK